MYIEMSYIERKLRGLGLKIFNKIENNGNCHFEQNGEKVFIENLFKTFKANGGGEDSV